jgi:two-component system cell cycle sensor histidine kinase/response regulator CckA
MDHMRLDAALQVGDVGDGGLQLVVERIPAAIAICDRDRRFIAVSRRFLTDYGLSDTHVIGRDHDAVFPEASERWRPIHRRCLAGATEKAEDEAVTRPDGQADWIRWEVTPWYTSEAKIGGLILFSEVITERKRLHDQLRQAQKMEAVGHLAGGIAHDFNNILTAIQGYCELLMAQIGPDKPVGRDLREIMSAAQRAATLTRQLLAFSRKQAFSLAALDLSRVVRNVEPMLRRLIGERIAINTVLGDDLASVMADATQLEQVLMNLVVNARDAMPEGGVLTILTANIELDRQYTLTHPGAIAGSYVMVSVHDTGIGMTPDIQAQIFEPFFTTKELGHGTGLGLAAVYGIVKQLEGYIWVESEPGRGTAVQIYLPKTDRPAQVAAEPVSTNVSDVGTETILLVEDEGGVRRFVKIMLQRLGYRVIEAESAEAALALIATLSAPIHLLLTDVVLPGMDGRQLAARVTSERPGLQVLYMSGYTGRAWTAGALEPGVHLLEKPFTAQALLTRIRVLLGNPTS